MRIFSQHFSVAEANAMLPRLRRWLTDLREVEDHLQVLHQRHEELLERRTEFNVGGQTLREYLLCSVRWDALVRRVLGAGVQLKDIRRGLCDFPHLHPESGDEVFLCWELGEPEVGYWHPLETGYAGRQPVAEASPKTEPGE